MQKEIKFQGTIELEGDDNHIERQLIGEMLNRLRIGIYTMRGAIRTKAESVKLRYTKGWAKGRSRNGNK